MRDHEVEFAVTGARLSGTMTLPDASPPWPGIVTIHGASDGNRDFSLFRHLGSLVVPAGFAILRYDRRGSGASGGDFDSAGFPQLGDDAAAALGLLAGTAGVDTGRLGIFGFSQGGWIAPEAARRSGLVQFMILVGACAVTPARQMAYAAALSLREGGFSESIVERALSLRYAVDDAVRGRRDRDEVAGELRRVAAEPWAAAAFLPAADEWLATPTDDVKWALEMDYDVAPVIEAAPWATLLIHGDHDRWTPIEDSRAVWQHAYRDRPDGLTVVRLPGTGHFPTIARGSADEAEARISPDYEALVLRWLSRWRG